MVVGRDKGILLIEHEAARVVLGPGFNVERQQRLSHGIKCNQ